MSETIRLWDRSGQIVDRTLVGHTTGIWKVSFHPQGHLLASAGLNGELRIWEVATGRCLHVLKRTNSWIMAFGFSPQGYLLSATSADATIRFWDAATGKCIQQLAGHTGIIGAVAFNHDGSILASGRSDCQIRLWDLATGECLHVLEGHTNGITSLVFLPIVGEASPTENKSLPIDAQPQILASGSHDETIRLWDVKTGECLQIFRPDRLYEGMNITGITGLTEGSIATLKSLGAVDR